MRTATIFSLCFALAAVFVTGCASTGSAKGPDDEALIKQMIGNWKAGMESKDTSKLADGVSEEFKHYQWGDKKGLISFLKQNMDEGNLDNAKINIDAAKITIDKAAGTAKVYPVELSAQFGSATIEFDLKKESDGQWRAIGINVEGV